MRIISSMIEVYDSHRLYITLHERRFTGPRYVTERSHMPAHHPFMQDQNRYDGNQYRSWVQSIGEHMAAVIQALLDRDIEETAYRSCMGILQFSVSQGKARLAAACRRARELHSLTYTTIATILKNRQEYTAQPELITLPDVHENLRYASSFV